MYYRKDIEHLYHAFMYSPISLLSGIYPIITSYKLTINIPVTYEEYIQYSVNNTYNIICPVYLLCGSTGERIRVGNCPS